jgi:hypothetical protein
VFGAAVDIDLCEGIREKAFVQDIGAAHAEFGFGGWSMVLESLESAVCINKGRGRHVVFCRKGKKGKGVGDQAFEVGSCVEIVAVYDEKTIMERIAQEVQRGPCAVQRVLDHVPDRQPAIGVAKMLFDLFMQVADDKENFGDFGGERV